MPPAGRRRPRDTGGIPEGHRGVHPTPLQCTKPLPRKSHRQSGGDQGTPEGHRCAVHQVSCLPGKSHRQSGADQGMPERHWRDTGANIRPLCGAPSPTPATQKPPAERRRPRDTGGTRGRTSDPFAVHQVPRLPRKSHRQSGGDQRTPEGHRGVHPTPNDVWEKMTCVCESDVLDVMLDDIVCGMIPVCVCAWCIGCDAWWYCVWDVCVCVSDVLDVMLDDIVCGRMGGQAGGRKKERIQHLKTKKTHVNVGKYIKI